METVDIFNLLYRGRRCRIFNGITDNSYTVIQFKDGLNIEVVSTNELVESV